MTSELVMRNFGAREDHTLTVGSKFQAGRACVRAIDLTESERPDPGRVAPTHSRRG